MSQTQLRAPLKLASRPKALEKPTGLAAHDIVARGIRADDVTTLLGRFKTIPTHELLRVLGVSERTIRRRAKTKEGTLDSNASDRALRLAAVTQHAIEVLGTQEEAERWLAAPAIGLDRRRPIDLLQSSDGTELVKTLLTRMDYGVYA